MDVSIFILWYVDVRRKECRYNGGYAFGYFVLFEYGGKMELLRFKMTFCPKYYHKQYCQRCLKIICD